MCADLVMRKRGALHAGEIGLFIDSMVFEDDLASIKMNTDVTVTATQSRSIKQMRLAWALAKKIADSGVLGDCDQRDAMNYLLLKARHVRYVTNTHRGGTETTPIVKSIRFASMDQTAFQRLMNRMLYIVDTEILPDMPEGSLRDDVERMAGVSVSAPETKHKSTIPPMDNPPEEGTPAGATSSPTAPAPDPARQSPAATRDVAQDTYKGSASEKQQNERDEANRGYFQPRK